MNKKNFRQKFAYGNLKKPCANCPFRSDGNAIPLRPGRLKEIINRISVDDFSSFYCHKTVHCDDGGDCDDEGNYCPSGKESVCAGAMGYLHKIGRPSFGMRLAVAMKKLSIDDLNSMSSMVIDDVKAGPAHEKNDG